MAITIGTADFPTLTAQPFGYQESDTQAGRTARKWEITGLLEPSEWLDLLDAYDTWRDARINDDDTVVSRAVGTTIAFSGDGPDGQSWTNVACWVSSAPSADQSGYYLNASITLVDANEALEIILREQDIDNEDLPNFGTLTLGTTTLTLRKPVDTFSNGPQLQLTGAGVHYTEGPLVAVRIRDVEGTTDATGWNDIRTWYETTIVTSPVASAYYPISPPSASAENKVVNGVKTTVYTVSLQLARVI